MLTGFQNEADLIRVLSLHPDTTFHQLHYHIAVAYGWSELPRDYYFEIDGSFVVPQDFRLPVNGTPCLYDANTSLVTEALGFFIRGIVRYRGGPLTNLGNYDVEIAWEP
jgi:hypothetical protein